MATTRSTIRDATAADAAACAAIYAPYVTDTAISLEARPPTEEEMAARIVAASERHAWLVLEDEQRRIVGYAYGSPAHPRAGYRWSCEVSVYVDRERRRSGAGRALYEALLPRLAARGYRVAVAGMSPPDGPSAAFHAAMGFEPVGTYRGIAYKLGRWWDVAWTQRALADGPDPPAEPS